MGDQTIQNRRRLLSIDALRGLVMLIMLLDHVRETVYLHMQVGDPVDVTTTSPTLVLLRFLSSFCAPAFVFLTGLGAYLYSQRHTKLETSQFLFKRGLVLILLEVIVINFAWTGVFPPEKIYLQIIWCIGLCMIALSVLIHLPRKLQIIISILIITGHNLLDPIKIESTHFFHVPWAILHQRDWIEFLGIPARTSYPVLAWVGVILGGFVIGEWFKKGHDKAELTKKLVRFSIVMLTGFLLIRGFDFYGDQPWEKHDEPLMTVMGFFTLTKYPPSLLFILLTLSFAALALVVFEKWQSQKWLHRLATFGSGAMFFYIFHLYALKVIYFTLVAIYGTNKGDYYGVSHPYQVVLWTLALSMPFVWVTFAFVRFKECHRDWKWLSYF